MALQTVLEAGGYYVETAASAAEAVRKLDEGEYQLVLTDLRMESAEAGYRVVDHAGITEYKPAVAIISTSMEDSSGPSSEPLLIEPEDLPELLTKVADLIAERASRRVAHDLRHG
ncbi:MAG: response regulator [bacterium]|nr:response regulator [bacterium]